MPNHSPDSDWHFSHKLTVEQAIGPTRQRLLERDERLRRTGRA